MRIILFLLFFASFFELRATHVMGGEITWKCQGGDYVFELIFYRDCNGADVNTVSETIEVWNHPSITSIQVNFISRTNLSPVCTQVPGSPLQLSCGSGAAGGNGIGAFEKITYRSNPISLPGTPPSNGWIFTAKNFSRSNSVTNLVDPSNFGITISAYMFHVPNQPTGCVDNSPVFLQEPYLVSCAGIPYRFNMNPVDPDLDSLAISFGKPLNNFTGAFNPPANPQELSFESGFNYLSPTPNQTFNPANVPAAVHPLTGELTFTSNTVGNFNIKILVKSYRNGILIAQVEREILLVVMNCLPTNNAPVVNGPFGGLFETTVTAGQLVNFTLTATDIELLQDGTPQNNTLTASGPMFGTNFTSASGCAIAPCATLNSTLPRTGTQGVSTTFNWQTSCDHLVNQHGIVANSVPYNFVFKITDDYCQVPKVSYVTITIHVTNPGVIPANQIECIQTLPNNDLQVTWTPINNATGSLVNYSLNNTLQTTPLYTTTNTAVTSATVPGSNTPQDFFLKVVSGCNGNTSRYSDTVSNIRLTLLNPANGMAVLQWNKPKPVAAPGYHPYYHIYREYPAGVWTLLDSVSYATTTYRDTIDICQALLNYKIILKTSTCDFTSNVEGDTFQDKTTPDMPVIESVSIDTLTGDIMILWDKNHHKDTYGYIIYKTDANGILFEIDTVYGINNTLYIYTTNGNNGPHTFSVAAFDSCYTPTSPVTFQTSAKAALHTTILLKSQYDICGKTAKLSWSPYIGWDNLSGYQIFQKIGTGAWSLIGNTTQQNYSVPINGTDIYQFAVRGFHDTIYSFSNVINMTAVAPTEPAYNYIKTVTVQNDIIRIKHFIELVGGIKRLVLQRKTGNEPFADIIEIDANTENEFTDENVDVNKYSYSYRIQVIDSCGNRGVVSNTSKNMVLSVQSDDISMLNTISWTPYSQFAGSITEYRLYRKIDDLGNWTMIATVPPNTTYYEDNLYEATDMSGKVCYFVDAIEAMNRYHFSETSRSNERCMAFEPLIYIPNAFTPEGKNPVFLPVVSLVNPREYQLSIINRWGEIIFRSDNIYEGWDGRIDSPAHQPAPDGVYVYVLQVKDGNGVEHTRRGHLSLIR